MIIILEKYQFTEVKQINRSQDSETKLTEDSCKNTCMNYYIIKLYQIPQPYYLEKLTNFESFLLIKLHKKYYNYFKNDLRGTGLQ